MKKLFILLVSVLLFSFNCSAQSISSGNYKGYVDAGYSIGIGDYEFGRVEINTSHGYQFNPYFFLCRKRSISTHSERLNPSSFTAKLALKSA